MQASELSWELQWQKSWPAPAQAPWSSGNGNGQWNLGNWVTCVHNYMWNGTSFAAGSCAARPNAWRKKNSCVQGTAGFRRAWHPTLIGGYRREVDSPGSFLLANCTGWSRNIHIAHFASVCRAHIMSALGLRVSTNVGNGEDCGSTKHLSASTWPTWQFEPGIKLWQETFPVLSSTFHCLRGKMTKMIVPPCSSQTDLDSTRMAPLTMPSRG